MWILDYIIKNNPDYQQSHKEKDKMNNFEYIKTLSLSQLASFLNSEAPACMGTNLDCKEVIEYWLSSPIDDDYECK